MGRGGVMSACFVYYERFGFRPGLYYIPGDTLFFLPVVFCDIMMDGYIYVSGGCLEDGVPLIVFSPCAKWTGGGVLFVMMYRGGRCGVAWG